VRPLNLAFLSLNSFINWGHALLIKFKCPKCDIDNSYSLADSNYQGPFRCWKCRELFMISIYDDKLKSCESITQEEFDRHNEIESLKAKFKKH